MALQAAIAGTGFIGRIHARSLRLAGAELAGVAASSPESAAAAAAELGARRAYDAAEELVLDPDVDVVHICTPNNLHLPLAEAALGAGKHVICEKPLATDAAGAQRLVDAAAGSGLQAAVPFVYRYYPTVREARERVAPAGPERCTSSTARISRTGSFARTTRTGGSTPSSAALRGRSRTSARTGATSPSSSPATGSRDCRPGC